MAKTGNDTPADDDQTRRDRIRQEAHDAEIQTKLEGDVFIAVNRLVAHMGATGFMLPGKVNPQFAVYVGDPDTVLALAKERGGR